MPNSASSLYTSNKLFIFYSSIILLLTLILIPILLFITSEIKLYLAIVGITLCILFLLYHLKTTFIQTSIAFAQYINKQIDDKELVALAHDIPLEYSTIRDHLIKQNPDVTTQEKQHKLLHAKIKHLEEQLEAKTTLITNASHEIRTPIQGVSNISQLLDEEWNKYDEDKKKEMVHALSENSKRLSQFVDSLLDLSKIDAGKMLFDHKQIDMAQIIKDVVNEFINTQLPDNNIVISYHIEKKRDFYMIGDNNKLKQLVRNLLSNAIKFTKKGKITISLRQSDEHNMLIQVQDEGMGIPQQEIGNIFEPFVQSTLTQHMSGSTGLGLALCKEIVEGHNGSIWAENNPEIGASFIFTLPSARITTSNTDATNSQHVINQSNKSKLIKLLMIDDEEVCHYSTRIILGIEPTITMLSAYSADQGLEILEENHDIDIILLDMMMPGIDGLEMLQMIRNNPNTRHIKVMMQSGIANPQQIQHAMTMGADSFATKPTSCRIIQQIFDTLSLNK